ncbi:NrsF family protein [Humitalea sp. 24SJ18S-53]|uniref:NrsF family protein n=1 Tax=Humitalea sp. 24SJ18S-53 TaxID=3422307 RepID=UPI003D66F4DC
MNTDDLIARLAANAKPVKPVVAGRRAMLWLAFAIALLTAVVLWHGLRPDLPLRLDLPAEQIQWLASVATGVLAAIAAARLAEPGRPTAWALLPVPAMVVWVAGMGWGCLADFARMGADALVLGTSWSCLGFIFGVGTPLLAVLLYLLKDGASLRPGRVSAMAGLAAAALCSAGLSLFHHLDAALMILVWHGMAVALVCCVGAVTGRLALAR